MTVAHNHNIYFKNRFHVTTPKLKSGVPLENEDTPVTTATQTAIMAYRTLGIIVIAAAKILTTEKVSGTLIRSKNSSAAEFCARRVAQTNIRLKLYDDRL